MTPRIYHLLRLAEARRIVADAALCAERPTLCALAWRVLSAAR